MKGVSVELPKILLNTTYDSLHHAISIISIASKMAGAD